MADEVIGMDYLIRRDDKTARVEERRIRRNPSPVPRVGRSRARRRRCSMLVTSTSRLLPLLLRDSAGVRRQWTIRALHKPRYIPCAAETLCTGSRLLRRLREESFDEPVARRAGSKYLAGGTSGVFRDV